MCGFRFQFRVHADKSAGQIVACDTRCYILDALTLLAHDFYIKVLS